MPMKQTGRKQYRSAQGKMVDMDLLRQKNELTPAVGNAKVNARGDELGPGGKIIRRKEDIDADYYADNPQSMPNEEAVVMPNEEAVVEKEEPRTRTRAQKKVASTPAPETKVEETEEEWVEDEDGNFIQKG